jgi:hypothetical protein
MDCLKSLASDFFKSDYTESVAPEAAYMPVSAVRNQRSVELTV